MFGCEDKKPDKRDLTAIKRLCTAFVKLLYPNATCKDDIPADEFIKYCLEPAKEMRSVIKKQLCIIDPNEFNVPGKKIFLKSNITISEDIMARIIYADNAATTQLNKTAIEVMKPFWLYEYANPSQPYSFSRKVKNALKEARNTIAECINALPNEIYFTSGGTESDNWAIQGAVLANRDKKR